MENSQLYRQFEQQLTQLAPTNRGFTVALSGGVDSVVLLHLCVQYIKAHQNHTLEAVYIDHGLSKNAKNWQLFCEKLTENLSVPFKTQQVHVQPKARQSLEALARDARYAAIDELAAPNNVILLGQHGDDQLETFLLRLKRGSGLAGLSAMKAAHMLASGRHCIRPLLYASRADIEAFAHTFALEHIEDESNQDDRFDRNFLRNQVVPLLKNRFRGFLTSSLRSIELLQQQQALIDELSQADLALCAEHIRGELLLNVNALASLSELRQNNVIRAWLQAHSVNMPSRVQLAQIREQALYSKQDAQLKIQLKQGAVQCFRNRLYWVEPSLPIQDIMQVKQSKITLNDERVLKQTLQDTGTGIRAPLPDEQVSIRFGLLKHQIQPFNRAKTNALKYWLKEAGVPTWQRAHIPLIFYNDELVQVVGFFNAHTYSVSEGGVQWEELKHE